MRRQELEITLSRSIHSFERPKFELEQYQTPPRVAANLLHRASELGDMIGKKVLDICAGTGILGIGASLLGAEVTCLEVDPEAVAILKSNVASLDLDLSIIQSNIFEYQTDVKYDVIIGNPPFGIQQKHYKDLDFIRKGMEFGNLAYFILDGSETNFVRIPKLLEKHGLEILETYRDEFPLTKSFPWHKLKQKIHSAMIIRIGTN